MNKQIKEKKFFPFFPFYYNDLLAKLATDCFCHYGEIISEIFLVSHDRVLAIANYKAKLQLRIL